VIGQKQKPSDDQKDRARKARRIDLGNRGSSAHATETAASTARAKNAAGTRAAGSAAQAREPAATKCPTAIARDGYSTSSRRTSETAPTASGWATTRPDSRRAPGEKTAAEKQTQYA
jgi:hypothetical protein